MIAAAVATAAMLLAPMLPIVRGVPTTTTTHPTGPTFTVPRKRVTTYSEAPFYDVFVAVSSGLSSMSSLTTRTHKPTTRTNTHKPTTNTHKPTTTNTHKPTTNTHKPTVRPGQRYKDALYEEAADQIITCVVSVGPFHVVLSPTTVLPTVAQGICETFGWNYANVEEDETDEMRWALGNCTFFSTGLRSFAGWSTGGCQFCQSGGALLMKMIDIECEAAGDFPILCKDMPVTTSTSIITNLFETSTTTTTTETIAKRMSDGDARGGRSRKAQLTPTRPRPQPIDKAAVAARRAQQTGVFINGYDVCDTSVNGYHLVYDIFGYESAEQVCLDLGWYLADIPFANTADILNIYDTCMPDDVIMNINSYDDFSGGVCNFAYVVPWPSVWQIASNNLLQCFVLEAPVLCQEDPTSITADSGTLMPFTTTTTTSMTTSVATNTVVITDTVTVGGP